MASAWLEKRTTSAGDARWRVRYRVGGRETTPRFAGTFATRRDALSRRAFVLGELAAMRVPNVQLAGDTSLTLRDVAEQWKASRVDVAAGTLQTYRVALGRLLPRLGNEPLAAID